MKKNILLLHGAIASSSQLNPLRDLFQPLMDTCSFDFSGHGIQSSNANGMSMLLFAEEIIQFIEKSNIQTMHVFGYSMGGYAAIVAAQKRPELFASITTLGTKFDWTPASALAETRVLDADKMQLKVPQFVDQLKKIHVSHDWRSVLDQTRQMMIHLGGQPILTLENMTSVHVPLQIIVGENDTTAGVEVSAEIASAANATFVTLKSTPHPLEKVDLQKLVLLISGFVNRKDSELSLN